MDTSRKAVAALALNRFGFGPRRGSIAAIAADPRGAVLAELDRPRAGELAAAGLPSSAQAFRTVADANAERRARQITMAKAEEAKGQAEPSMREGGDAAGNARDAKMAAEAVPNPGRQIYLKEAQARIDAALASEIGFAERLVWFWSNHFCISAAKGPLVRVAAGCFEREAIRPHVLGRFGAMLQAVESHPAMLAYLDNALSFGPNSPAGRNRNRGLNENLAREILELHTLGVDGGYTQADVTALARIITGWTFSGREGRLGEPGTSAFFPNGHEPGDHKLLGKVYAAGGVKQGEAALADLARHPATARHIAGKLARHFVADEPPPSLVDRLAKVFRETDGDLKAVAIALVDSDEAWATPLAKMRTPEQFLLAALRAIDRMPEDPGALLGPLNVMGMPLWQPPGPNGWPDTVSAWASPKAIKTRLDVAAAIAARVKDLVNPSELLETIVGASASGETRQAIARAESRQQGLALLLMSPEFQWR